MTEFIVATAAAMAFIIAIYYILDYRKEKREWRKRANEFYHDGAKRKSVLVLLGDRYDRTEAAQPLFEKLRAATYR
ncbi:hypothetical protein [Mesobacillus boroniphilus]|uniref:Uncharacterized protein n=1 Tax=Mesobacillus boroniphilus JCM 21738 TaxID=1294265 RepID=W4RQR7_9BACI|nr:hypothetical protein [Mesobacillus boroniphilus]GAE46656.1 hypothetical protein JCM21738_3574 [Mesobacillus boroniphilus JCM 21738]